MATLRVAVLEVGHWHFPLYWPGLRALPEACIVAVSDRQETVARRIGEELGVRWYTDVERLLAREEVEFAFAFGRHADMPTIATALIEAGVPFSMEKPMGLHWSQVRELARQARERNLFVAVPYTWRYGEGIQRLLERKKAGEWREVHDFCFRLLAGPPHRYVQAGCQWMLEPSLSGGGCAINLLGHGLDLFMALTGEPILRVQAWMHSRPYGTPVEEVAWAVVETPSGAMGVVESSYSLPGEEQYERLLSLTTDAFHLTVTDWNAEAVPLYRRDGQVEAFAPRGGPMTYPDYAREVVRRFRAGEPPLVGLEDMVRILAVLNAAYDSARRREPVEVFLEGETLAEANRV